MNCQGPCLFHCYKTNSIILLLIGILIGICLKNFNIDFFKSNNVNDRRFDECDYLPRRTLLDRINYENCKNAHYDGSNIY